MTVTTGPGDSTWDFSKVNLIFHFFKRNEIVDIDKNDLYVMRYKPIGNYVSSGQIQLI